MLAGTACATRGLLCAAIARELRWSSSPVDFRGQEKLAPIGATEKRW